MIDAIGNVLAIGDIVMVALGAKGNRNNSSLIPCRVEDIQGNRCLIMTEHNVKTDHDKIQTYSWACRDLRNMQWKFSRQVVKVEKYITMI